MTSNDTEYTNNYGEVLPAAGICFVHFLTDVIFNVAEDVLFILMYARDVISAEIYQSSENIEAVESLQHTVNAHTLLFTTSAG